MFIGDETIRRSHRISGETRFAWVNELGVVSELSDPVDIDGYRHVVVSPFPVVPYDRETGFSINGVLSYGDSVSESGDIWKKGIGEWVKMAGEEKWEPVAPSGSLKSVYMVLLEVNEGVFKKDGDPDIPIAKGIYGCVFDDDGNSYTPENSEHNRNMLSLEGLNVGESLNPYKWNIDKVNVSVDTLSVTSFPRIKRTNFGFVHNYNILAFNEAEPNLTVSSGADAEVFAGQLVERPEPYIPYQTPRCAIVTNDGSWIKFSEEPDFLNAKTIIIPFHDDTEPVPASQGTMVFTGRMYEINLNIYEDLPGTLSWEPSDLIAIDLPKSALGDSPCSLFEHVFFDTWRFIKDIDSLEILSVNMRTKAIEISNISEGTDIVLGCSKSEFMEWGKEHAGMRFALWNSSAVKGVSQRCFADGYDGELTPTYTGRTQPEDGNFNIEEGEYLRWYSMALFSQPLMTLDYTGIRSIPMPFPVVRRALRNPQHLSSSSGKLWAVEDGKLWVGDIGNCMMTDYVEVQSGIDHMSPFDAGVVIATRNGLFYVSGSGEGLRPVNNGDSIRPRFMKECVGGVLVVEGREISVVYKHVTQSGSWYPAIARLSNDIPEINLEGELKSVSIGRKIYLADDYNVWIYDQAKKIWCGKKNYNERIRNLYTYKNKLGIVFDSGIDKRNSFDQPGGQQS